MLHVKRSLGVLELLAVTTAHPLLLKGTGLLPRQENRCHHSLNFLAALLHEAREGAGMTVLLKKQLGLDVMESGPRHSSIPRYLGDVDVALAPKPRLWDVSVELKHT